MALAMVTLPVRLICRMPLSMVAPVPSWPVAPPAPTLSVLPALMVVVPEQVLARGGLIVRVPVWLRLPVPEIRLGTVRAAVGLKCRVRLSVAAQAQSVSAVHYSANGHG